MQQNKITSTDTDYSLKAAIKYFRDCISQLIKNQHSGYHACTVLKMLGQKHILTETEVDDLRTIKLDTLPARIEAIASTLKPSTQRVYINTAKHAINEFIGWMSKI